MCVLTLKGEVQERENSNLEVLVENSTQVCVVLKSHVSEIFFIHPQVTPAQIQINHMVRALHLRNLSTL